MNHNLLFYLIFYRLIQFSLHILADFIPERFFTTLGHSERLKERVIQFGKGRLADLLDGN